MLKNKENVPKRKNAAYVSRQKFMKCDEMPMKCEIKETKKNVYN